MHSCGERAGRRAEGAGGASGGGPGLGPQWPGPVPGHVRDQQGAPGGVEALRVGLGQAARARLGPHGAVQAARAQLVQELPAGADAQVGPRRLDQERRGAG
eukprot:8625039-Pyramimonas_sp.AAC.1